MQHAASNLRHTMRTTAESNGKTQLSAKQTAVPHSAANALQRVCFGTDPILAVDLATVKSWFGLVNFSKGRDELNATNDPRNLRGSGAERGDMKVS